MKGKDILSIAKGLLGNPYRLGAYVPKNKADYKGDFDCAEFVCYCLYQSYSFLYGTELNNFSRKFADDAYTGYLDRDAHKLGKIISVEEAARTPGAILLRVGVGTAIGHTAISIGNGKTYEAHSTKYGCISSVIDGRRWSYGILLPNVDYTQEAMVLTKPPILVYRLIKPYMKDAYVGKIQRALGMAEKQVDNIYGPNTQALVVAFQKKNGLVPDGEIMPGGETARSLKI